MYREEGTEVAAHYTGVIWTTAHVLEGFQEVVTELESRNLIPEFVVVRSGTVAGESGTYEILDDNWIHPDYDGTLESEDVGLLFIDEETPVGRNLVVSEMVNDIDIGQAVGTLGFPGALGIAGGEANFLATPTFKDGVISCAPRTSIRESPNT